MPSDFISKLHKNFSEMADIYVRKRGKGSRISKPKWIHINPKKFKKIPPSDNANAGKSETIKIFVLVFFVSYNFPYFHMLVNRQIIISLTLFCNFNHYSFQFSVQNNIRRKRNFPTSSSNGQQPVHTQRTPAASYFYSNQQNTEETNEEEKRICRFYTIKGICKRFKSECKKRF